MDEKWGSFVCLRTQEGKKLKLVQKTGHLSIFCSWTTQERKWMNTSTCIMFSHRMNREFVITMICKELPVTTIKNFRKLPTVLKNIFTRMIFFSDERHQLN